MDIKIKYKPCGEVERYKARLVVKGFTQTCGADYFEMFAPVDKMATLWVLLTFAAAHNWKLLQMDITNCISAW